MRPVRRPWLSSKKSWFVPPITGIVLAVPRSYVVSQATQLGRAVRVGAWATEEPVPA